MAGLDYDRMSLQDFIRLQRELAVEVRRRFERPTALIFTDVVGSTAYISRFGDVAGRVLLQRHHELLERTLGKVGGRLVDTAGDGAFCVANSAQEGASLLTQLQSFILADNATVGPHEQLAVRSGMHWGLALVGGELVTGESVHTAARIMGTAEGGQIRISREAFDQLSPKLRTRCAWLEPQQLKGFDEAVDIGVLDWRAPRRFPTVVEVVETGVRIPIPIRARVTLGRLTEADGAGLDHLSLWLSDPGQQVRLSRRQIALEMTPSGYVLENLSPAVTEVDGRMVSQAERVRIRPGSEASLSRVMTLRFVHGAPSLLGQDVDRAHREF